MINDKAFMLLLLIVDKKFTQNLRPILTRDIHEQNTSVFHKDGLFSTEIFGDVGSKERSGLMSYIDINTEIIHPKIYAELTSLSKLYKDILAGTRYAIFDEDTKALVETTAEEGNTGYKFMLEHLHKLEFTNPNKSDYRGAKIELLNKFSTKEIIIDRLLVMPAGLREYMVTESGKVMEDEINGLYRKLITVSHSARLFKNDSVNDAIINKVKVRLQHAVNTIYSYIENILEGKGGYFQNKATKRSIFYSTRNVITSTPYRVYHANANYGPDGVTSTVGIMQGFKGIFPIAIFNLRTRFLNNVFDIHSPVAKLADPKTKKATSVTISEKTRTKWITDNGLEKMVNKLKADIFKNQTIVVDGHWLFMVYETKDNVHVVSDIDMLPEGYDSDKLRGITYGELMYLTIGNIIGKYPGMIVRYPITGFGSIVPSKTYVKSTVDTNVKTVKVLDELEPILYPEYPVVGLKYFASLSIPALYLDRLQADFDGDKTSYNMVWEDGSIKEIMDYLHSYTFLSDVDNKLTFSANTYVNSIVMKIMSEQPIN